MSFNYLSRVITLRSAYRRAILILLDTLIVINASKFTLWLSGSDSKNGEIVSIVCAVLLSYIITGQYKSLTKYLSSKDIYLIGGRNLTVVFILLIYSSINSKHIFSLKESILFWIILTLIICFVRFILRDLLLSIGGISQKPILKVAIYGSGEAGAQLAASLKMDKNYIIKTFIDDSSALWSRTLDGIPINPPSKLIKVKDQIDQVLLAIPSLDRKRRKEIVNFIQKQELKILQMPSLSDLTSGRANVNALRPILIEDLLGRESVPPLQTLLGPSIKNSIICVTGAGGSIGSELCRQIIKLSPQKLILFDWCESNLYTILKELKILDLTNIEIVAVLGDSCDEILLTNLFCKNQVELVFHAAAYKHVPLVQANPLQGLRNNIFSTFAICNAANRAMVKKLLLISTDKAVRPSNVMGASKRFAEMIVQGFADLNRSKQGEPEEKSTCFSMVRFGNVLNSSGSVVPLFKEQITSGGPITITHQNIIRYFMTIPEAAQLLIQASVIAEGGEVFLLDMGEPVKIMDLAKQMIHLTGLTEKTEENPAGDIQIIVTGLRSGEKLYEELLVDTEAEPTLHPLIFRAKEKFIALDKLKESINIIEKHIKDNNTRKALEELAMIVPEWTNHS